MKIVKILVIALIIYSMSCALMKKKADRKVKLSTLNEIGRTIFRTDAKSLAQASKKFYANMKKILGPPDAAKKADGGKKIENSGWIGTGYNIAFGNPIVAPENGR
jgi:phosphoenolpyruvate carboxylase